MLPFKTLVKKLGRLEKRDGINQLVREVVREESSTVINYNTDKQLEDRGVGSDNKKLTPKYKRITISIKKRKGQPSNRVTLKDTGAFHKSFFIDAKSRFFTIRATNEKSEGLEEKYGDKIFGLTSPNKRRLAKDLKSKLILKIRKRL